MYYVVVILIVVFTGLFSYIEVSLGLGGRRGGRRRKSSGRKSGRSGVMCGPGGSKKKY